MLLRSLPTVLKQADKSRSDGDQEMAYILFMRYMDLVKKIKNSQEYKKDRGYFDGMIGKEPHRVMMAAEELSKSLDKSYAEARELKEIEAKVKSLNLNEEAKKSRDTDKTAPSPAKYTMTPVELYRLMSEKATTFLLVDARPVADFRSSHMMHTNVINVPEEKLTPGITAKAIDRNLHIETRGQWGRRNRVDKLIVFDWKSEKIQPGYDDQEKL